MTERLPIRLRLSPSVFHALSREHKPLTRAAQDEETLLCHLIIEALGERPYVAYLAERLRLAGLSSNVKRAWYTAACERASPEVRPFLSAATLERLLQAKPEHLPRLRRLVRDYRGDHD